MDIEKKQSSPKRKRTAKKKKPPITVVIFDLDGTLYAMNWLFKPLFTSNCFPQMLHLPKYMKVRNDFRGKDFKRGDRLREKMGEALKEKGVKDAQEWIGIPFYKSFVKTLRSLNNRSNIVPLLRTLKKAGLTLVVLSDFGHIDHRLAALNIPRDLFDECVSCEEEGALKPHTRSIEIISERLGIPANEMLMVGDKDDTDGELARKSGMRFFKVIGTHNKQWNHELAQLRSYIFKNR